MAVGLTVVSNELLGVGRFLRVLSAVAIVFMTFALVGLAAGMGARYPRFGAENLTQVAGSFGGVAFMVLAVLFILATVALLAWPASIYLLHQFRGEGLSTGQRTLMGVCFLASALLSGATFWLPMRRGIRALEEMG